LLSASSGCRSGWKGLNGLSRAITDNPGIFGQGTALYRRICEIREYVPLAGMIERFWLDEANRESETWTEHSGINVVMLATSLAPEGFLAL